MTACVFNDMTELRWNFPSRFNFTTKRTRPAVLRSIEDFIINYDIKYRMGDALGGEEEEVDGDKEWKLARIPPFGL
jgi:hypothetical protein